MSILRNATRGLATAALLLAMGGWASAAELKENTADIKQDIRIPGMAVTIKRPGNETGCDAAKHEKWDSTKGGCSNTEYMKESARVVSVQFDDPRLSIGVLESTQLKANVRTQDGQLVGAGIPVTWSTTKGYLSTYSNFTDADSQATVTLTTPKGTATGLLTATASAKAGGASTLIAVGNSATVSALTANPPTALADGVSLITLEATLTYYENGKSVGAGEPLSWGTKIGSFTYAENVTNPAGKAVAYLVSTDPGTAFVSATKDVPVLQQVTFSAPVPIGPEIHSFSVKSKATSNGYGSKYWTDNLVQFNGEIAYWQDNIFSWSASGADRFEIVDAYGRVHYSGSDSEWHVRDQPLAANKNQFGSELYINSRDKETFTLKAFKGQAMASKTIEVKTYWYQCGGGCSM